MLTSCIGGYLCCGVVSDPVTEAVQLFKQSAAAGCTPAMHNLAVAYSRGAGGVAKDELRAIHWFEQSGNADSMRAISAIYTSLDQPVDAQMWLLAAARAGDAPARQQLQNQRLANQQFSQQEL